MPVEPPVLVAPATDDVPPVAVEPPVLVAPATDETPPVFELTAIVPPVLVAT
jgi:hypothetical protein